MPGVTSGTAKAEGCFNLETDVSTCTRTSSTSTPEQAVTYCVICFCSAPTASGIFTPLASATRSRMISPFRVF